MQLELVNLEEECTGPDPCEDDGATSDVSQVAVEDQPDTNSEIAGVDESVGADDFDEAVISIHDDAPSQVDAESAEKAEGDLSGEKTTEVEATLADEEVAEESPADDGPANLLEELDLQQNEVIAQLDELNDRIERLLGEWTQQRSDEKAA